MVGEPFFHRSAGACPPRWFEHRFFIVVRGPVPRDGSRTVFYRSAVACPPRSLECACAGEGQALALRYRMPFFMRRFRSFRTYMSIETRIGPYQGPLGP